SVAVGKDLVAMLRDVALFIVVLALFVFPVELGQRLEEAGFDGLDFGGISWRASIEDTDLALREADQTISNLRLVNDSLLEVVSAFRSEIEDPELEARIGAAERASERFAGAAEATQATVRTTIAANAPLVAGVRASSERGPWFVVAGGDPPLAAAQDEVAIIERLFGIANARIILRQGSYRTVVPSSDYEQAQQIRERLEERRPDAYLVRQNTWCGELESRDGFAECTQI